MKKIETLRAIIYLGIGFAVFYAMGSDFFWDHVPAPVSENIGKIFAGVLLLLMISPVIIVLVDAVITKERPSFLARVLKKSKWYEYLGALVFANLFLFVVLAMFFEGGAYPWGEIIGSNYYVSSNIGEFEVSADWFWISYWHGLSAWAGAGIYGVGAFLSKVISDVRRDDQREAVRSAYGLLFVLAWLGFVLWGAVRTGS
jgi:hypothetical protein